MLLARTYSHNSLLSALPQIPKLVSTAKKRGYTAIALTDEDTTSGLIEFYDECNKQGVKPILGTTLRVPNFSDQKTGFKGSKEFSKICILAKNSQGYTAVLRLVSIARTVREKPDYHVLIKDIKEELQKGENFYVLITGNDHEFGSAIRNKAKSKAKKILEYYRQELGAQNILIQILNPLANETVDSLKISNQDLVGIGKDLKIKYLVAEAPRYLNSEDEEAFRVVLAIRNQVKLDQIKLTRDFALSSAEELKERYKHQLEVVENQDLIDSIDIKILTNFDKNADEAYFPKFPMLEERENPSQRLIWDTYIGFVSRFSPQGSKEELIKKFPKNKLQELIDYAKKIKPDIKTLKSYPPDHWDKHTIADYIKRIEYELDIIIKKGYPEYFLVFGDIMKFCRKNGIQTNTRGSAAGSLVGYLNEISVLDPLLYILPFERFLNPLRPSPPDIDGDFADDKRDLVIDYITERYGEDKVAQIITFGTMLPKAAVRDVGRVLGVPYKKCDRLSKLIPNAPQGRKTTFNWAFETSKELKEVYENDPESKRVMDISMKIEGNFRHSSCHAAGILISPTVMTDYASLQWDTEHNMRVAQYDMKICEKVGLVKLDILGITNLAILGNAIELTEKRRGKKIDLLNIDIHNQKAFELLSKGKTMGIFQLSSSGMTRWLTQLEPTRVEDLMAMVALYRPGPMANIPEYIKRKRDPKQVTYYIPEMEGWMKGTYGILVYQEDLLLTAINVAGYDWKEADVLRKGMGKKVAAVIESQHPKFVEGCIKNGKISKSKAEEIWEAFVPFSDYGFNKSHSASYGMVAYWTAYLKAEYTVEFMTAYMTSEANNLDKIANAIRECKEMGIEVKPPDVNKSLSRFSIEDDQTIRYGLSSVKNLGSDVIKFIIQDRQKNGQYSSLDNFLDRTSEISGFNKRSIEALILSGSLDSLGYRELDLLNLTRI